MWIKEGDRVSGAGVNVGSHVFVSYADEDLD
jgi:hypothetical protein